MLQTSVEDLVPLRTERLARSVKRPEKSAEAVRLNYVNDKSPGITRKRAGKGFSYSKNGRTLHDAKVLARIRALAIPPAWKEVWICADANGHLQATGLDVKGRKQYRYHTRWSAVRGQVKFHRMHAFGKRLPKLRQHLEKDMRRKGLPKEKVLAGLVSLMEHTRIRLGGKDYEKNNGSFGLSTLKDHHLKHGANGTRLRFKGKSGVLHDIPLRSRKLARLAMRCKELPGQELFQFLDEEDNVHDVDSNMVNAYFREACGGDFTSKDMRTWIGSARCMELLLANGPVDTKTACTTCINTALDGVAKQLGNTRAVCRSHYVHPRIIHLFQEGGLADIGKGIRADRGPFGLDRAEKALMKICRE